MTLPPQAGAIFVLIVVFVVLGGVLNAEPHP